MSNYTIKGTGQKVVLTNNQFKAQGGEGKIFIAGNTAYKIYLDIAKMIPEGKFNELSVLTDSHIIRPQAILLDSQNKPVGYSMLAVGDCFVIVELFPKAFRDRHQLKTTQILSLAEKSRDLMKHLHKNHILAVDHNEMNILVTKDFKDLYFIDVDSYQTPHYPATAIMETIRDVHHSSFSQETDWFSFGVVSFQMFTGIHPYKGNHPAFENLPKDERLHARMKANVSVFDSKTKTPPTMIPIATIPKEWQEWYKAVFQEGKRIAPPDVAGAIVILTQITSAPLVSDKFMITVVHENLDGTITQVYRDVILTDTSIYWKGARYCDCPPDAFIGYSSQGTRPIIAYRENGKLQLFDVMRQRLLNINLNCKAVMATNGRVYIWSDQGILEIDLTNVGDQVLASSHVVGTCHPLATQLFEGCAIQNLLGSWFASLFPATKVCYQQSLKELLGYKVLNGAFKGSVLILVAEKGGKMDKFIYRYDENWTNYDLRIIKGVDSTDINFAVLETGVCIHMNEEEKVEIFSARLGEAKSRLIEDPAITGECQIISNLNAALFAKGNTLYKFGLK